MNSKLNITIYEEGYDYNEKTAEWAKIDVASGSITLDLSKLASK